MARKTIKHASFWYTDDEGRRQTARRGDTVNISRDDDLQRGERHGAFASPAELSPGSEFLRSVALQPRPHQAEAA